MMTNNHCSEFVENNIHFRIISSKLLERYKSTQSFVLTEMLHGQFKFSKTSREISLLKMDLWFQWLNQLERYLIKNETLLFDKEAIEFSIKTAHEAAECYTEVVNSRPDIFDVKFVAVWTESHQDLFNALLEVIRANEGKKDIDAFAMIANFLVELMDTLKYELYEIDYLMQGGKKPFLCMSDLCVLYTKLFNKSILPDRAKVYMKHFDLQPEFYFKNYSQDMSPLRCVMALEDSGIKIVNNADFQLGGVSL